jgi:hypothetical protein
MYDQEPQNPIHTSIDFSIGLFVVNWSRHDTFHWKKQMKKMMLASFKNWAPVSIKKAAGHVIQTNVDDFPPSQGKIIQQMKEYMGTASLRTASIESCARCSDGLKRMVFWLKNHTGPSTKYETNAACSDCEKGKSRKTKIKNLIAEYDLIRRIENNEIFYFEDADGNRTSRVINKPVKCKIRTSKGITIVEENRYIWIQTYKGEQAPLHYLTPDIEEIPKKTMEHQSLIRDRMEAKKKHIEAIEALQKKIEERENANKDPNEKEIVEVDMETYFNSMNFQTNKIYLFRDKFGREYKHET